MDLKAQQYDLADTLQLFRSRLSPETYHQTVIALSLSRPFGDLLSRRFRPGLHGSHSGSQGKHNRRPHFGIHGAGRCSFPSRRSPCSRLLYPLASRLAQHNTPSLRKGAAGLLRFGRRTERNEGVRDDRRLCDGFAGGTSSPLLYWSMRLATLPVGTRLAAAGSGIVQTLRPRDGAGICRLLG